MRLGIVSDTHGLLRPEALDALAGVERIVHAGDIGTREVLAALEAIAPVTAVRGNNDHGRWASRLPASVDLELGGLRVHVIHDVGDLRVDPARERISCVIAGHSHRPRNERVEGVLWLNPGSAGPRRFSLPIALARATIARGRIDAEIVELKDVVALRTPAGASGRRRKRPRR